MFKYSSIENYYNQNFINKWLEKYPQLKNEIYVITEKLHGTNIGIRFDENWNYTLQSRNKLIQDNSFYGILDFFEKYDIINPIRDLLQSIFKNKFKSIIVFGEFFGKKIQKGVDYIFENRERDFKIFDIAVSNNGENFSFIPYGKISTYLLYNYFVPIIEILSLDKALNYDVETLKTEYGKNSIAEGIVIRPFMNEYNWGSERFILKKKAKKFLEVHTQKDRKQKKINSDIENLQREFLNYINENRINSVFSKEGIIKDLRELGKYIKLILEDAWIDFVKDYSQVLDYSKSEQKQIKYLANKKCKEYLFSFLGVK